VLKRGCLQAEFLYRGLQGAELFVGFGLGFGEFDVGLGERGKAESIL
jgi:hypothetical protein